MEFLLLHPDPVAERTFAALDAWTRPAWTLSREHFLTECLVGSREATPQAIARDRLSRVHLDLTLTHHRYEGFAVVMSVATWSALPDETRRGLAAALLDTTRVQREAMRRVNQAAIETLARDGMQLHSLSAKQRAAFRARLPAWEVLLRELPVPLRERLLRAAGATGDAPAFDERAQPSRGAPRREADDDRRG
jgi:hypothetical protein